jgi:hypothetical protein
VSSSGGKAATDRLVCMIDWIARDKIARNTEATLRTVKARLA